MNLAVIGCGYVAEFYGKTLGNYPSLVLVGAYDRNGQNLDAFLRRWPARKFISIEELLADSSVELVLNLTDPRSHFEITRRCLEAGKPVYSEKPLAMDAERASELVALARRKGLYLASAPCSVLSETAQTVWKALRDGVIGKVRLVYANFDDGMIAPKMSPWAWLNGSGVPWPAKDEFEVGCTYEHAGYLLTWLAAFFGPARSVTAFSSCQIPEKGIPVDHMAPDFSVGCIIFDHGIVARVTCSVVAPEDKSLTIIGDDGVISVANVRNDRCPVHLRRTPPSRKHAAIERRLNRARKWLKWNIDDWQFVEKLPLVGMPRRLLISSDKPVDFCRGPAEMVAAIQERRPCRLFAELGLHITELIEALQYPKRFGGTKILETTFPAMEPVPWLKPPLVSRRIGSHF